MNNYLILSDDKVVIDERIDDIVKKIGKKDLEIIKMDLTENTIGDVLEELNTYNFLSDMKVVILYNASFIEGDSTPEKDIKKIINYLNQKDDNTFIMVASKQSKKELITELVKNVTIIDNKLSTELLIKNNLGTYKMDKRAMSRFLYLCDNNNEKIINELDKLKMYKSDDPNKMITYDDVEKVVFVNQNNNVFDLANAIVKKDRKKAIDLYNKLIEKEDSSLIVATIASRIRMLYSIKVLKDKKMKVDEIADVLKVKPAAVSISMESADSFSTNRLLSLLYELSEMDINYKMGIKVLDLQFKQFLMDL